MPGPHGIYITLTTTKLFVRKCFNIQIFVLFIFCMHHIEMSGYTVPFTLTLFPKLQLAFEISDGQDYKIL